jgi:hypothetical protein
LRVAHAIAARVLGLRNSGRAVPLLFLGQLVALIQNKSMSALSRGVPLIKMAFKGAYGETEFLWATPLSKREYVVLSTPLYVYGVSPGSHVVGAKVGEILHCDLVITPSPGAVARIMAFAGHRASSIMDNSIRNLMSEANLEPKLCAYLDPRIGAIYVSNGRAHLDILEGVLDSCVEQGLIRTWELADPEESEPVNPVDATARADVVFIPPPLPPDIAFTFLNELI